MIFNSTVIITLQLSNPSSAVGVTLLKCTAFDKIKGWLQNLSWKKCGW